MRILDETLAAIEKAVADIRALHIPQADQPAWNEVGTAFDKLVAKLREVREAANAGDQTRTEQLAEELDPLGTEANTKADAFGFKDCGSSGS